MSEADSSRPLRLGDEIFIKLDSHNAFLVRSIGIHGHGLSVVELRERDDGADAQPVRYLPDISDALFTLCPGRKHSSGQALRNLKQILDENDDGDISHEEIHANASLKGSTFQAKVSTCEAEAESERIINATTTKHSIGNVLSFGDEVQLQHSASGEFVSSLVLAGCNQVSVMEDETPSMIFVVSPCYKSNQIGDPVYEQSFFTLKAVESGQYIASTSVVPPAVQEHPHMQRQVLATVQTHNGTEFHAVLWDPVSPDPQEEQEYSLLHSGSVVEMRHMQSEAFLGLTKSPRCGIEQRAIELTEFSTTKSLWRVELLPDKEESYGGREVKTNDGVLLRHFNTGQYLQMCSRTGVVGLTNDSLESGVQVCSLSL